MKDLENTLPIRLNSLRVCLEKVMDSDVKPDIYKLNLYQYYEECLHMKDSVNKDMRCNSIIGDDIKVIVDNFFYGNEFLRVIGALAIRHKHDENSRYIKRGGDARLKSGKVIQNFKLGVKPDGDKGALIMDDIDESFMHYEKSPEDKIRVVCHYEQKWTVETGEGAKYDALSLAIAGYNAWIAFLAKYGIVNVTEQ